MASTKEKKKKKKKKKKKLKGKAPQKRKHGGQKKVAYPLIKFISHCN